MDFSTFELIAFFDVPLIGEIPSLMGLQPLLYI